MRAYFFWADQPMSWLRYKTIDTFQQHNPDWKVSIYTAPVRDSDRVWKDGIAQDFQGYDGPDWREHLTGVDWAEFTEHTDGAPNYVADMCRWWHCSEVGGVFFDMDILFIRPMTPLPPDGITCNNGYFYMGAMSSARSPVFRAIYDEALRAYDPAEYQSVGVGPVYRVAYGIDIRSMGAAEGRDGIKELSRLGPIDSIPYFLVHPFLISYATALYHMQAQWVPAETVGVHWWAGAAQEWARSLTPDNVGRIAPPLFKSILAP